MKYQEQEIQKKLLLSFFYPILRVTKIKKIFNKIKIKQLRSNPTFFFKFQSRNKKFLNSFIKKKKNTKLFKNFLLLDFYKKTQNISNVINIKIKIKQLRSNPTFFFKFQSRNKKFLNSFIKKKKNTKLFKNFLLLDFYKKTQNISNVINIKINPNNTMVNLADNSGNIKYKLSAGMLNFKSSKKNYKLIYNLVLTEFFKKLKNEKITKNLLFRLSVPKSLRRRLVKRLKYYIKNNNIFEGLRKLPFNGCRPPKMRRKKS